MTIALIPARGGSKGVPGKNIKKVGGIPLVGRSIIALQNSINIERIFVSTDDEDIAAIAIAFGAEVINRPSSIARDQTSTDDVIDHAMDWLSSNNIDFDVLCLVQATYPFLTPSHVDLVYNSLDANHDCAFGACRFHGYIWKKSTEAEYILAAHEGHFHQRKRRQDEDDELLLELGSVYVMRREGFLATKSRFCNNPIPIVIEESTAVEVDSHKDLEEARLLEKIYPLNGSLTWLPKVTHMFLDFDGVLTDNYVLSDSDGNEVVKTSKSDSLAISLLRSKLGINVSVVTSEVNSTNAKRCKKLGIRCHQVSGSKGEFIENLITAYKDESADSGMIFTCYVGNDVNDLSVIDKVDVFFAPSDSDQEVLRKADYILTSAGGHGVVKEIYHALKEIKVD